MNDCPDRVCGGSCPVVAMRRHSMMVVFPAPFAPTMSVRGLENSMTALASGGKERTPLIIIC